MRSLYLRVRDHRGKQYGVGVAANNAFNTADADWNSLILMLNTAHIITMYGKTCRVSAGTAHLMKLQLLQNTVIKFLRNSLEL